MTTPFRYCLAVTCIAATVCGCAVDDPNRIPQMRFQMAQLHAVRVLKETKSSLRLYPPDYDLEKFRRRYFDDSTSFLSA